jgi:soluble lytic murein transglycosylase-like protein
VTVAALRSVNQLSDPNFIYAGERLVIPGKGVSRHRSTGPLSPIYRPAGGTPTFPSRLRAHPERLALLPSYRHWSSVSGVPAGLLEAMAWMESGWQTKIVSSTGALGVGQLEPQTVRFVSLDLLGLARPLDPRNPDANVRMSAAFLAYLLGQTGGNVANAVGGYYQGLASLARNGPWDETRQYVLVVGELWSQFRSG